MSAENPKIMEITECAYKMGHAGIGSLVAYNLLIEKYGYMFLATDLVEAGWVHDAYLTGVAEYERDCKVAYV